MSSDDTENRTPAQATRDADASGDMEQRLEQLDEHIDDARKKAAEGRPRASPDDDVIDDVAGGGTDNTGEADDPAGPIVGPE
ncbi:MAG TPA: hypothetical protein VGV90_18450 [Solirubrobacteraceae bacterium]|nr:hypothetical protein [Solirubrobacteraceae bacterium]